MLVVLHELTIAQDDLAQIPDLSDIWSMLEGASIESSLRNLPSFRSTIGPSASSQGVTAHAFPGRSIFICVPTVRKSSTTTIVAGAMPRPPDLRPGGGRIATGSPQERGASRRSVVPR